MTFAGKLFSACHISRWLVRCAGFVIRAFFGLTYSANPLSIFDFLRDTTAATFENGHVRRCEIDFHNTTAPQE